MRKGWSEVAFTDIATLMRRPVQVTEDGSYPEVGVRCFGKGLFHKPPRTGLEVGDKKLFRLQEDDFILQVTFAWEGAVGIVSKEDEMFFGSVRVLTFEVDRTPKIAGELASLLSVVGRARGGVRGAGTPALADSIFR